MLGIKASPLAELTQLNWENGVDIPGTVQSFNTLKDSDLLDSVTGCGQVFTGWPQMGPIGCVAHRFGHGFHLSGQAVVP